MKKFIQQIRQIISADSALNKVIKRETKQWNDELKERNKSLLDLSEDEDMMSTNVTLRLVVKD